MTIRILTTRPSGVVETKEITFPEICSTLEPLGYDTRVSFWRGRSVLTADGSTYRLIAELVE